MAAPTSTAMVPIREFADAVYLRSDPQALFDKYEIDYVLFGTDQLLAGWLQESAGWERVYADDLAGVWVRSESQLLP